MCVFSAALPPKKHTLVLFEAAGGGLKKNILFRTRYLAKNANFRTDFNTTPNRCAVVNHASRFSAFRILEKTGISAQSGKIKN